MQVRSAWSVPVQRIVFATLAAGLAVCGSVAGHVYHPEGWAPFDAWAYLLTGLVALPLAWCRSAPVVALAVSCASYAGYLALGYQPSLNWWAPMIALVSVAALRAPRVSSAASVLTGVVILYNGVCGRLPLLLVLAQGILIPAIGLAFGYAMRLVMQRNRELRRLSAQLANEQAAHARNAVLGERVRIARELHDVVAHHLSAISVQAGLAAYVFHTDGATARSALSAVADSSREALDELRRLLSMLRVDDGCDERGGGAPRHAPPGLSRVGELAERLRAAHVGVTVHTRGTVRKLALGPDLCAYRVVQEALTNVVKHAAPTSAYVHITYEPDHVTVTVLDDGRSSGDNHEPAISAPKSGYGLIGMQERAHLCGGSLSAGPRREGGYEVRLTLPTSAAPTVSDAPDGGGP
ncbi:sensor histidine kinase [Streptomyces spectabilis]|uniref:histidine kinase n=1 Tax=Streptomyces spectabilis TaxID=68270 RepID=A0A516RH82_STRST|nr:sensor histidine kinase [Streptomyces spectabilis]QDQ15009.1 sensor histidine kinase [Streptomyces spectabilis]